MRFLMVMYAVFGLVINSLSSAAQPIYSPGRGSSAAGACADDITGQAYRSVKRANSFALSSPTTRTPSVDRRSQGTFFSYPAGSPYGVDFTLSPDTQEVAPLRVPAPLPQPVEASECTTVTVIAEKPSDTATTPVSMVVAHEPLFQRVDRRGSAEVSCARGAPSSMPSSVAVTPASAARTTDPVTVAERRSSDALHQMRRLSATNHSAALKAIQDTSPQPARVPLVGGVRPRMTQVAPEGVAPVAARSRAWWLLRCCYG